MCCGPLLYSVQVCGALTGPGLVGEEGAGPAASPKSDCLSGTYSPAGDRDSRQPASKGEKKVKIINTKADMLIVRQASSILETNST